MSAAGGLELRITRGFQADQDRLGPRLQHLLTGEVHHFVRTYESAPATAIHGYDTVEVKAGLPGRLIELEVGAQGRVIAHWQAPALTLVLFSGRHDGPARVRRRRKTLPDQVRQARPAPAGFWPDHESTNQFFDSHVAERWQQFAHENDPDWLYRLSPNQSAVVGRIRKLFKRSSQENQSRILVMGGPGTGKTSVLLVLLHELVREGLKVGIVLANQVAEQASSTAFTVEPFRRRGDYQGLDLLLVDDPPTDAAISAAFYDSYGHARAVVVAVDPAQMAVDFSDRDLKRIERREGVRVQRLRDCYRQKDVVGAAGKRVMERVAESSPYRADDKVARYQRDHRKVNEIANDLAFINKGGLERTIRDATEKDVKLAVAEIRRHPAWTIDSPPLLVTVDPATEVPWSWEKLLKRTHHQLTPLDRLHDVKGLEFQWVFVVVGEQLHLELEHGFIGASVRAYDNRRLLRIPFSRARDGVFTFVVPDPRRAQGYDPFAPLASRW